MQSLSSPRSRGRPRNFNPESALTVALEIFRRKGYEGASVDDLTEAMGISKPSMYRAFGNKEALFDKAMDLYEANVVAFAYMALEQPTARKVAEHFLIGALEAQTRTGPTGCLRVLGSIAYSDDAQVARERVIARLKAARAALTDRLTVAREAGDLPGQIPVAGLVSYLYALVQGMAVQAAAGVDRAILENIVAVGVMAWPSPGSVAADRC